MALRFNEERPGQSLLLGGHADSVGPDKSNGKLSEKRAELTHAMLTGDRGKFVDIAHETGKVSDWKAIFAWTSSTIPGFEATDPGKIDDNAATGKPAAIAFQEAYNLNKAELGTSEADLKADGAVGKKTWGAIFDVYQFNMADELGEVEEEADIDDPVKKLDGLGRLRGLLGFLPTAQPFLGFGEKVPVNGIGKDNLASAANRRVEMLFFEQGQEPDVGILGEAPEVSELNLPGAYEKAELQKRTIHAYQREDEPLRIWLLDDERRRMGARPGSSFVLEQVFGAPYRLVLPDGGVRVGYADENAQAKEFHVPEAMTCELWWGRARAAEEGETLPEDEETALEFFQFRRTITVFESSTVVEPLKIALENLGFFGERPSQLESFASFYDSEAEGRVLKVHRSGEEAKA